MRKTFAALDDVLIERVFQPVSDLVSNQTGLSKAATACICIDIASLSWIFSRARGLSGAITAWDPLTTSLDLALLLLGLVALISLRSLFRRAATRKQANPLRQAMQPHRAIILLMLATRLTQLPAFDLTDAADLAMLLCASSALYLGACVERPPVRRRQAASLTPAPLRG
jgi:hypothetical protein